MPDTLGVLGALLAGGTIGTLVNALFGRKKVRADATRIITDTAAEIVQTMREERTELWSRVKRLERQHSADRDAQVRHTAWDRVARQRLAEQGIDLPEPPPLYAPDVT